MRLQLLKIWNSSICALAFCCSTYGQEPPLIPEPETGQLQSVEGVLDRTDDNEFVERLASENTPEQAGSCSLFAPTNTCKPRGCHIDCLLTPFIGVEATYLKSNIGGTGSSVSINDTTYVSQPQGFNAAPRIWGGFGIGCTPCFVQLQYWQLDGGNGYALNDPSGRTWAGTNTVGASTGALGLKAFDFEIGSKICLDRICSTAVVTFGGRYAQWDQTSTIFVAEGTNGDNLDILGAAATNVSDFSGTGFTSSYLLSHQNACSNWSLFGQLRNSYLWGNQASGAATSATGLSFDEFSSASAASLDLALGDNVYSTMWISEIQLGTQWQSQLQCMNASAFFRIAVEFQYWDTHSNSNATSFSFAQIDEPSQLNASASANSGPLDMTLMGLAVSTGLNF